MNYRTDLIVHYFSANHCLKSKKFTIEDGKVNDKMYLKDIKSGKKRNIKLVRSLQYPSFQRVRLRPFLYYYVIVLFWGGGVIIRVRPYLCF